MKYKTRWSRIIKTDEDASTIANELAKHFPNGNIQPKEVVEIARSPRSALHTYFEWDDDKAAEAYRVAQARTLIKCIVVEQDGDYTPAYQHVFVQSANSYNYTTTAICLEDESLWEQVVDQALREAVSWSRRYESYKQLAPIHEAIIQTKERINEKTVTTQRS